MPTYPAPNPPYVGPAAHVMHDANGPWTNNTSPLNRIVIHGTVSPCVKGGARATAAYFREEISGGSAHYVVDPGEAVQVVWDREVAEHAPPNSNSIGVELCDPVAGDPKRWGDRNHTAMLKRAATLVAQLCLAYDVPVQKVGPQGLVGGRRGICGHVDVAQAWHQTDHTDPGPGFPWAKFLGMVRAERDRIVTGSKPAPRPRPRPTPTPTPAPRPAPVPKPALRAHELRIASVNMKVTLGPGAAQAGLDKVVPHADVIGLQEWGNSRNDLLAQLGRFTRFGRLSHWLPRRKSAATGWLFARPLSGGSPIGVRADKLQLRVCASRVLAPAGKVDGTPGKRRHHLPASRATIAVCTNLDDGKTDVFIDYHLTAEVQQGKRGYRTDRPLRVARHKQEVASLERLIARYQGKGYRVWAIGDSNFHDLQLTGLTSCWGHKPGPGTLGGRNVDAVSAEMDPDSVDVITSASDHDHPVATYTWD